MATENLKNYLFTWEGRTRDGDTVKGQDTGPSEAFVKAQLRRRGIIPVRIRKKAAKKKGKKRIQPGDIAIFTRQLATMMNAGVPLVQSFDIVGRGHDNPAMQELLLGIKNDIEGGTGLTEALARHPKYFDSLYTSLVGAGERSGALETLLDKVATYMEKSEALKSKIKKALVYPAAIVAVAVIVSGILLYFVVPQFQSLFQGFGANLPAFTLLVVGLSKWTQKYWWAVVLVLGGLAFGVAWANRNVPAFREAVHRYSLKIPVIGTILRKAAVARYARTLATMFAAGVPLVDALDSVAGATGNLVYERAVQQIRDQVATGQQLQSSMQEVALFPHMAVQMIAIGEESGDLDSMAAKVADFYEAEVDDMVDNLSALLEPMIMVILGILVGGLVIAMYLPIFKLGSVVS
ncbi:MAG TPA: type II secretion system F family protein [Gammaproteobacteria bacterium]|nr:type II secretion system F family protein [Gammaproteobacteria bacterium]